MVALRAIVLHQGLWIFLAVAIGVFGVSPDSSDWLHSSDKITIS
ncbi:hypothetical protein QUA81_14070 [Microcoleus sp. F6_B4]